MNGIKLIAVVLIVLIAGLSAQSALAAKDRDADSDGYTAPKPEEKNPWLGLLFMLVAAAGVLVVAFKNARRTHLD